MNGDTMPATVFPGLPPETSSTTEVVVYRQGVNGAWNRFGSYAGWEEAREDIRDIVGTRLDLRAGLHGPGATAEQRKAAFARYRAFEETAVVTREALPEGWVT